MDTGLFGTWFWSTWFSFDHVHLSPERISTYIELKKTRAKLTRFLA